MDFSNYLLLQWGKAPQDARQTVLLSVTYKSFYIVGVSVINAHNGVVASTYEDDSGMTKTLSSFGLSFSSSASNSRAGAYWLTLGH